MSTTSETDAILPQPSAALLWSLRAIALAATGVAVYLLYVSLSQRGLPFGCSAGSGCSEVLTSRWSSVLGVPVSGPAAAAYLGFLAATFFIGDGRSPQRTRLAWSVLVALSALLIAAAAWFVGLQIFVLKAICPWCMAEHVLGVALALPVLWHIAKTPALAMPHRWPLVGAGTACVLLLVVVQAVQPYQPPRAARLPPGKNHDTGPGPQRLISVLNGDLQAAPHELPHLGSADAPKLLAVLFDYCCPHCRAAHGYLKTGLERYPGQLGVVMLPMPLDSKCNPHIEQTEPRFEHSCELARLALAVWLAKPEAFVEFDAWLFEPELPRTLQEARQKAEQLVAADALDKALSDPWIKEQIAAGANAYAVCKAQSGLDRLPIIMSPGFATLVGRPGSEEELFETLEQDLQLKQAAP
jgi:uncharacterized membrane protein/protein-disulfide isomerase